MKTYGVSQLAKMAGISVRTLHHYDHIGLLVPHSRTGAGYRVYGEQELLRLQQILFYRELDFPLDEVRRILDDPGFDPVGALRQHRDLLGERVARLECLLNTIDRTIERLVEGNMTLTDEELYGGFPKETIERYKREARERYDPAMVDATERKVKGMSREKWQAVQEEGGAVAVALAAVADRDPRDSEVQELIARHHAWIENFYVCSADRYRGLSQLYVQDPEFRAFYEKFGPNLADFLSAAMNHYADHILDNG